MTPAPPLLDFETLLAPISADEPAGSSVPFDVREKLEEDRKEEDPTDFAEDDPMRPDKFKKADWPGIIRLCTETLTKTSKDLLIAARLTEALVKQHGFTGLRDGLHLLRQLVEQCWDRVNPVIESPDDLDMRAGPFNWLDDPDRGARFPNTLRNVPVVKGEEGQYGWVEWKQSQDGRGGITRDAFDKAVLATPLERCQAADQDLTQCFEDLTQLTQALGSKMGPASPGLTGVRQALDDCRILVRQILKIKNPGGDGTPEGEHAEAGGAAVAGGPARPASSRAEAYRQLSQAAAVLQQLEPHSPIPYLIQRAVELGALPFPLLIKALIREQNVLAELSREFGLKDQAEAPKEG